MSVEHPDLLLSCGRGTDGGEREPSCCVTLPTVTVLIPVYNESAFIERALVTVLFQDYPEDRIEVLIADGGSTDQTVEYVSRVIAANPGRRIRLLKNPLRTAGAALNLMIREATGEILVRVDGHAEIAADYVRLCVQALITTHAVNVGGYVAAAGSGFMGEAIASALGSFWGNGGARYRSRRTFEATYVETVPFGAWWRSTFDRLGLFEEWRADEDDEFNARILDSGGDILLHPGIRARYMSRRTLASLARQYFQYGRLKCRVIARHPRQLRLRQVVPPALVLALLTAVMTEPLTDGQTPLILIAAVGYLLTLGIASAYIAFQARRPRYAMTLPTVFATLHLSYGTGALLGVAELLVDSLFARTRASQRRRRERRAERDMSRQAQRERGSLGGVG